MLCYVVSFLMARQRTALKACRDHKSREYALSLCGVTFRDTLCAPRASFPRTYHHNQRVVCLRLCRQRVKHQPTEKLVFEQRSGAKDFRSKSYRVSTCSFQQTFVPVLTIAAYSSYNIKQVLPAPFLETSTFSGVSLMTLLVLSHRLYLPSKSCALA